MPDFDPRDHLVKLKGKDYLEVRWRLMWLTETQEHYTIDTEAITINDQVSIFRAIITTYDADGAVLRRATGTKSETPRGFADYIEKSETGAIGRALGALGFGTQYAVELASEAEADRPVDTPTNVHRPAPPQPPYRSPQAPPAPQEAIHDAELRDVPADRATPAQLRALWTAAEHALGANKNAAVRGLLARRNMESTKQLSRQQASNLIDYLGKTTPDEILATAGVAPADDAGQAAMPMDGSNVPPPDEADLIHFRERAEADQSAGGWAALLDEAGTRTDYLATLATVSTTIGRLDAVTAAVKQRGRYNQEFIAAERKVRPGLEARVEALTR